MLTVMEGPHARPRGKRKRKWTRACSEGRGAMGRWRKDLMIKESRVAAEGLDRARRVASAALPLAGLLPTRPFEWAFARLLRERQLSLRDCSELDVGLGKNN